MITVQLEKAKERLQIVSCFADILGFTLANIKFAAEKKRGFDLGFSNIYLVQLG